MTNNMKSPMIAGVLGIILGSLGVHQWYLGEQKQAKRHLTIFIGGVVLLVAGLLLRALMPSMTQIALRTTVGNIATVLRVMAWIIIIADVVWGAIEGILLLVQGEKSPAEQLPATGQASVDPATSGADATPNSQIPAGAPVSTSVPPSIAYNPTQTNQPASNNAAQSAATNAAANIASGNQPSTVVSTQSGNLVFSSSNIQNSPSAPRPDQAVGTKDVAAPALTVQGENGKEKMNPVVKRWLLSGIVFVVAALILGLLIKTGFDSILASAYGETYRAAKEIKPTVERAHKSSACEYAVQYVKSAYVDRKTYDDYVNTCKSLTEDNILALIDNLGKTPMLRWSSEISQEYKAFREAYVAAFPENTNFEPALKLYQTWHNYVLATDILTVESEDVAFQEAADILRTSGNTTLAQYGEIWLEKELDYIHAYRTYQEASYTDPNKDALRQNYENLRADLQAWVADHRPNVLELEKVTIPNTEATYESFTKMYDLIKTGYEKHYDRKSGDCNDSGRTVYCN